MYYIQFIFSYDEQNIGDDNLDTADAFDNAGRAMYSIGFMTTRAFQLNFNPLDCGQRTFHSEIFDVRKRLADFQKSTMTSTSQHPLEALGDHLPDLVRHDVNQLIFRARMALSCLFEEGVLQSKQLLHTIDSLASASRRKITILETILHEKISDLGQSATLHSCLVDS